MTEQTGGASLLAHYATILWRRKWFVVGGVVIAVAVAAITAKSQGERWAASAKVLISSNNLGGLLTGSSGSSQSADASEREAATAADLATSTAVKRAGLEEAKIDLDPGDVDLEVSPQSGADLLRFTVHDPNPAQAEKLASAMAQGYVAYIASSERRQLQQALRSVQDRLDDLDEDDDAALRQSLEQRETQLQTALDLPSAGPSVVPSDVAAVKEQPKPKRAVLLGLVLGLLAGLAVAGIREALDTRVRGSGGVSAALGLPVLGVLSRRRGAPAASEAVRGVTTAVLGRIGSQRPVVITVPEADGGTSGLDIAAEMAGAAARGGESTILVRVDGEPWGGHNLYALNQALGDLPNLDTYLASVNGSSDPRVLWGTMPEARDEDPFAPRRIDALVTELRHRADVVIVGTPPLAERHEGTAFAAASDAVVMVVNSDAVPRGRLQRLTESVSGLPARVLGFVAVGRNG